MKAKSAIVAAAAAFAFCMSSGIASATPDVEAIATSACNYNQVMAALQDQSPAAYAELSSNTFATGWLQSLLASTPDQRRAMIAQFSGFPEVQEYAPVINQVAYSCMNY